MSRAAGFIVVFDDQMGLCSPMGPDSECEGAICCHSGRVTLFPTQREARKAIRISAAFARLCAAQGKPANEDFTTARKHLRILPLSTLKKVS